jgi:hypothetical protein
MNDHRCMRDIPAADVVETVQAMIHEVAPK